MYFDSNNGKSYPHKNFGHNCFFELNDLSLFLSTIHPPRVSYPIIKVHELLLTVEILVGPPSKIRYL